MRNIILPQPTEEKPYEVSDYPYGFKRTKKQYWIETTKRGQRVVTRTLNPKTNLWNKPKKSTYSEIRILYINTENNHIENDGLNFAYTNQGDLNEFLKDFPETNFSEYQLRQLKILRAIIQTRKHIKVSIVENPTPEQRKEMEEKSKKTNTEINQIFRHYLTKEK